MAIYDSKINLAVEKLGRYFNIVSKEKFMAFLAFGDEDAIDSFGNIGISYADSTNSDLKFAFAQTPVALPTLSPGAVGLLLAALLGIGLAVRSGQEV